jgi:Ni2+-binding GTPase involved in maturation of urease and hydrogenase
MKEKFATILLIAGSGQNVGKTTLACHIIQKEKEKNPHAVKITPHFHQITEGLVEIKKGNNWALYEETCKTSKKDSSLYLQNGAVKSYLIQTPDSGLTEAFSELKKILPPKNPVVIESAALINIIQPGLFILVLPAGNRIMKKIQPLFNYADLIIKSDGKQFFPSAETIIFENVWRVK